MRYIEKLRGIKEQPQPQQPLNEQQKLEVDTIVSNLTTERGNVEKDSLADNAWGDARDLRSREDAHEYHQQGLISQIIRGVWLKPHSHPQVYRDNAYIARELFLAKLNETKTLAARHSEDYGTPFTTVYEQAKQLDQFIGRQETHNTLKKIVDTTPVKPKASQQPQQ